MVGAFGLFVTLGTVGLVVLLTTTFQRWSRAEFEGVARANAEFIAASRLAPSEPLAGYLGRILGVTVAFGRRAAPDGRHEAVTAVIEPGLELTLIRERPTLGGVLRRPVALGTLVVFWGLWFGLAWGVMRPYLEFQRLAMLGRMATSLAHEIQNPVAAIRLHGQLLAKADPGTASMIVDEATAIEGLVSQWMFLARPEPPAVAEVDLAEVLRQAGRLLGPAASHAGVEWQWDVEGAGRVRGDARRLGQVFRNLMVNAIQAMPEGGVLTVAAKERSVRVSDTGRGFSPTALRRWSDLLFSEKEGGMGIGLSVAREIVRAHGGRLSVGNRPEGGAWVSVEL